MTSVIVRVCHYSYTLITLEFETLVGCLTCQGVFRLHG